jgi:hypothetical protein
MAEKHAMLNGAERERLVRLLILETGVAEAQALDLISLLGTNWPSLVREAEVIAKRPSGLSNI